ncbi:MAG: hypothetical protein IJ864_02520 [Alphaproteobacteria bacterium]|nr:hypothetical protein [Alphaproteobacteria bacterium]
MEQKKAQRKTSESKKFWIDLRATIGLVVGIAFFVFMTFGAFKLDYFFNDAMDPVSQIELLTLYAFIMLVMTYIFWYDVLNSWVKEDYAFPFLASVAMFVLVICGIAIFTAFMAKAVEFYCQDWTDWVRLLPIVVAIVSIIWLLRDVYQDLGKAPEH